MSKILTNKLTNKISWALLKPAAGLSPFDPYTVRHLGVPQNGLWENQEREVFS